MVESFKFPRKSAEQGEKSFFITFNFHKPFPSKTVLDGSTRSFASLDFSDEQITRIFLLQHFTAAFTSSFSPDIDIWQEELFQAFSEIITKITSFVAVEEQEYFSHDGTFLDFILDIIENEKIFPAKQKAIETIREAFSSLNTSKLHFTTELLETISPDVFHYCCLCGRFVEVNSDQLWYNISTLFCHLETAWGECQDYLEEIWEEMEEAKSKNTCKYWSRRSILIWTLKTACNQY